MPTYFDFNFYYFISMKNLDSISISWRAHAILPPVDQGCGSGSGYSEMVLIRIQSEHLDPKSNFFKNIFIGFGSGNVHPVSQPDRGHTSIA